MASRFFSSCLSNFVSLKFNTSGRFSVKVNTTWPKERDSETKKMTHKGWQSIFFHFQILLSHNNNHSTAPCGLAAASNVDKGGGGSMPLDSDQSGKLQRSTLIYLSPLLPLCLIGPSQSAQSIPSLYYLGLTLVKSYLFLQLSLSSHSALVEYL